jgi:glycerophosphoryl diester phosphodiesterase
MKRLFRLLVCLSVGVVGLAADPVPLLHAHAHNDYEHTRPLFDALDCNFGSVEADVYLIDGQLLVAHQRDDVKLGRTLEKLYLDPLRERVRAHGGRVYRGGPTIVLLVDVKTEAVPTYAALHAVLRNYSDLLTVFRGGVATPGAITVIVSGNRARAEIAAQSVRYAAIDGRPDDLKSNPAASLVPLVSADWNTLFTSRWTGPLPEGDRAALEKIIALTHAQGRQLRFWNTPDRAEVWQTLLAAGVDVIGTDDLPGLQKFLLAR